MKVLVTGATGGIGREICSYLAANGHDLIITSRNIDSLTEIKANIEFSYKVFVYPAVVDFEDADKTYVFSSVLKNDFRAIDGVVLIYPRIERPETCLPSMEMWQRNFLTAFVRPLEALKSAVSIMPSGGRVVIVSGTAAVQVFPQRPLANVIRSAWLAQAKTMAFELGRSGIHVNTVSLGGFLTKRIEGEIAQRNEFEFSTEKSDLSPYSSFLREDEINALGKYGDPKDAAQVIAEMLFNFSNHITGANIICDGGYTRHYG